MKPYYSDDAVQIFHGGCQEILPHLDMVDVVLTDPPYGNGDIMNGGTWGAASKYADMRRWDKAPDASVLLFLLGYGAKAMVWGGNYFSLPPSRC